MNEKPSTCETCGRTDWGNPTPVVVILQPIISAIDDRVGLAMARRAIQPQLGRWAFMGGHVNHGECLEEAAAREWHEETNLTTHSTSFEYIRSFITANNHVLAAFRAPPISTERFSTARLCPENSEFGILWRDKRDEIELAFPIHRELANWWFQKD